MKKMKGGEILQVQKDDSDKSKWNGIHVDGQPLSQYFKKETETENKQAITEEIKDKTKKKRRVYIREKHQPKIERSGKMTTLPQDKLNETNLNSNLEKAKTFKQEIISYLLAGQKFTAVDIQAHYEKRGKRIGKQPIWNVLSNLMRTDLAQYVERKREKKNGNVQYRYWLSVEGLQLQPEGAFELSKHYIKGKEPQQPKPKKKKPGPKPKTAQSPDKRTTANALQKGITNLKKTAAELMANAGIDLSPADLNINVTGKVDIIFTFKMD
jgi:hypothetical protein